MASTGDTWRLGHRPALDGLRGVAVLLVVICHAHIGPFDAAGPIGVTVFFTLSGFLITSLLLEERCDSGGISLPAFYLARARRLFPALAAFLSVMTICALTVTPWAVPSARSLAGAVLYIGNWLPVWGERMGGIEHTWSLAVEEQFYLIWPPVLMLLMRARFSARTAVLSVAGMGIAYSVVARAILWDGGAGSARIYYGSDTRADALLIGCALAALLHGSDDRRAVPWLVAPTLAGVAALGWYLPGDVQMQVVPLAVPLLTAVITVCCARGGYVGWLSAKPLTLIGRRSYGLYLWHFPLLSFVMPRAGLSPMVGAIVFVGIAWCLTLMSWRYVEEPFLIRRLRAPTRGTRTPTTGSRRCRCSSRHWSSVRVATPRIARPEVSPQPGSTY